MKKTVETDIVIVGGGIAGLWLLNRLRQFNFSVILLESKTLGGGQTHKSQGIIHGGVKYALQGGITGATQAISTMPQIWTDCLNGNGMIDLSQASILSSHQYLWSTGSLVSKLAVFFAGLALNGNLQELSRTNYPAIFQNSKFNGQVYSLDEMVVDVPSVIHELVKTHQDVIFKIDSPHEDQFEIDKNGNLNSLEIQLEPIEPIVIKAQKYIFTAGAGNEKLVKMLQHPEIAMQRRPLHMVLVETQLPYALYAHCLGLGSTPRITITTHKNSNGKIIWYLGGQVAEEGVKRNSVSQIQYARKELAELFPWLDFSKAKFTSFFVDRAEAMQPHGKRPDSYSVKEVGNSIVAWPTKLAFAPKLAEDILAILQRDQLKTHKLNMELLRAWPIPAVAKPIWDEFL